jgi:predicted Zn-ribbon and HTH transcriptional regulator
MTGRWDGDSVVYVRTGRWPQAATRISRQEWEQTIVTADCERCGASFEDVQVAVREHGGWCPKCDQPSRR